MLKSFYDTLYFYHYNKVKKRDTHPEIVTLGLISFCQSANFISLMMVVSIFFEFSISKYVMISISIILFALNYYLYQIKGKGKEILKKNIEVKNIGLVSFIYSFFSAALPFLLMYVKMEFF